MTEPEFPVESFKDAVPHLRRPFTSAAVKFKVQAVWPKEDPKAGLIVAYIDARLAIERLNLVVPHLWYDAYRPIPGGLMWCDLTVDYITRSDVGEGRGKGLVSDALKRASVKFGIGVSLYAIPKMVFEATNGTVKQKRTKDGLTLEITPKGEKQVRDGYAKWLREHGSAAFGNPLDHGDVDNAQGDAEVEVDMSTGEVRTRAEVEVPLDSLPLGVPVGAPKPTIPEDHARLLVDAAKAAGVDAGTLQRAVSVCAERDVGLCDTKAKAVAAVVSLTEQQAKNLEQWISAKAKEGAA